MMQAAVSFKNNGGLGQISVTQPSHASLVPWWLGSQPLDGEPFGQLKSFTENHPNGEGQLPAAPRQMHHAVDPRLGPGPGPAVPDKGGNGRTKSSVIPGDISFTSKSQSPSCAISKIKQGFFVPVLFHRSFCNESQHRPLLLLLLLFCGPRIKQMSLTVLFIFMILS